MNKEEYLKSTDNKPNPRRLDELFYDSKTDNPINFDEKDREKVMELREEMNTRQNLKKFNKFMSGQEESINYSKIQYIRNKIVGLAKNG